MKRIRSDSTGKLKDQDLRGVAPCGRTRRRQGSKAAVVSREREAVYVTANLRLTQGQARGHCQLTVSSLVKADL